MIQNNEQLINSQERLAELRVWEEEAAKDIKVQIKSPERKMPGAVRNGTK